MWKRKDIKTSPDNPLSGKAVSEKNSAVENGGGDQVQGHNARSLHLLERSERSCMAAVAAASDMVPMPHAGVRRDRRAT